MPSVQPLLVSSTKALWKKCSNNFHICFDFQVSVWIGQNVFQNDERPHKIFNYTSAVSRADKFPPQLTICFWTCQINPTNQFLLQLYFLSPAENVGVVEIKYTSYKILQNYQTYNIYHLNTEQFQLLSIAIIISS